MLCINILQEALADTIQTIFSGTDVFVVCYSAVQPKSFKNVQEKWIPRIRYYMGDRMPIVLVATQTDLRDNQIVNCQLSNGGLKSVSRAQGHALAKRIGCASYIECSPNMQKKVKQIINKAISSVLIPQGDRLEMQSCTIL